MNVLMFGWEFPPYISGGLGTACHGLTTGLTKRGVDVTFVLPKLQEKPEDSHVRLVGANRIHLVDEWEDAEAREELLKILEVDTILMPYLTETSYRERLEAVEREQRTQQQETMQSVIEVSGDYGRDLVSEVYRFAQTGSILGRKRSIDIIHAHDWMTFPAGIEAKKVSGKPLIVHVHATEFDRSGDHPNQMIYDIERWGVTEADRVIAVSNRTRETLIKHYGADPAKVFVVHNAVTKERTLDPAEVKNPMPEKIVLFLGRITLQKGPDYFVEAAHKVLKKIRNVRFVMAGTGDMLPRMIERMAQLRMLKHFHFTGFLRGRQIEEMYAMSDLYVMPSVSEPFGITPFEAVKYGVPVIISRQSGIAEVLKEAIKVDFWDVDQLADSIVKVLTDDEFAKSHLEANQRELDQVNWDIPAGKVLDIYHDMTEYRS